MKEWIIRSGATAAVILPEKGATVVSLTHNGQEYLYRDQPNLDSPERPRCGIPFLFPIFGRLKNNQYQWDGDTYSMEIHGFGHTSVWSVVRQESDALTLALSATAETLAQYPFRFHTELEFRVTDGCLAITQTFENRDEKPMPYSFGFHPYFLVEDLSDAQVETSAGFHFDFSVGRPVPFGHGTVGVSIPEGAPESGSAFMEVSGPTTLRLTGAGRQITMEHGDDYPQIVLWTQAGKSFLCVEPINGTADGLNTGIYHTLLPGQRKQSALTIHTRNI